MTFIVHRVRNSRRGGHGLLQDQLRVQDVDLLQRDLRHVVQVLLKQGERSAEEELTRSNLELGRVTPGPGPSGRSGLQWYLKHKDQESGSLLGADSETL
ncbi:hypothetical protein EYF80_006251 [Liparis tanakae]|uniref:Uncharacterized protein n=1 Tax=Liparis tanakae TaxID=230148 RepID=A0A4Z2IZ63_9TELE|nr:hypothetical protein EYF80_006251 [Liparis tanakae]